MPIRACLVLAVAAFALPAHVAAASPLAPHHAVYDLSLSSQTGDLGDVEGRIALDLSNATCGVYDLDYRFVARFRQDQDVTLTDQRTISTEDETGEAFRFTTKTFVDGSPEKEIRGEARREGDGTRVSMEKPEAKSFTLPLSRFPLQHTAELIAKAEAGESIVETKLFDGDDDAQKLLTTTSVIGPNEAVAPPPPKAPAPSKDAAGPPAPDVRQSLAGLRSWRISESYYNQDSDPDGLPVFRTSYVLYENGVSDDLMLDFGTYVLAGSLSTLDVRDTDRCRQ